MKKRQFIKVMSGLAVSLGLSACSDTTAPSAGPTATGPATSTAPAASSTPGTTEAGTSATATGALATVATTPAVPTVTTVAVTPTVAPVVPTPTIAPTRVAFEPVSSSLNPPGGYYNFSFAGSNRLVFYDKPAGESRAGSWFLDLASGQRSFLTTGFGTFTPDLTLAAISNRAAGTTLITNLADGKTLGTLTNRASSTLISPDKKQVVYLLRGLQQEGSEAPQRFELWVANGDGQQNRLLWRGLEADNLAWFPDSQRLLWTARDSANRRFGLWSKDTSDANPDAATLLVESKGLTVAALSGNAQWAAYWVTLQGAEKSGVWLAKAGGSQPQKMDWVGGFRWAGDELFYLPVRANGEKASALWSYNPATNQSTRLTDPARLPLQIALDQWQIAPDGKTMIFRNAADNKLWRLVFRP